MKKILSIMLAVLMCFGSMFCSTISVSAADSARFTIGNATADPGDTVSVDITYSTTTEANLIALASITLSSADAEIVGFEFSDAAKAVINAGLSNYDADKKSIVTLFNAPQTFDGVIGTLQIKVGDRSKDNITISATSRVLNEGVGEVASTVTDGTIDLNAENPGGSAGDNEKDAYYTIDNVEAKPGETATVDVYFNSDVDVNLIALASIALSGDDAEIVGFAFSDEAKAVINTALSNYDPNTKSVIALFNQAQTFDGVLGTLQIKVADDAEEGVIEITASSRVQNEGVGVIESGVIAGELAIAKDAPALEPAKYTIGSVEAKAGETVDVEVSFKSTQAVNLVALSSITLGSTDAEIVGFEFSDVAKAVINTALSNYDANTKSLIVLFNSAQSFDGVLGTLKVKIAENAPAGNVAITAGSRVQNEGVGEIASEVTAGNIAVAEKAVTLEGAKFTIAASEAVAGETVDVAISYTTDTPANLIALSAITFDSENAEIVGFEFSDAAKAVINIALSNYDANTKSIIALFNNAQIFDGVLGTLKVKIAESAPTADIAITAGSRVQNEGVGVVTSAVTAGKIAVTAKMVAEKYTVTYKVNGEVVKEFINVEKGSAVPEFTYNAPAGYTFSGWGEVPDIVESDLVIEGTIRIEQPPVEDNPNATLPGQRVKLTAPEAVVEVGDTVEIPVTISNPNTLNGVMVKVTWDPTMLKADPTKKMGKWNCYTKPADNADGVNMFGAMFDLNGNDAANGVIIFGGAAGYEFEDYTTEISLGTLKFTILDGAEGRVVTINVDPVGTYATSLRGNEVLDYPVGAAFKVAGDAPVINYYTVTYKVNGEVVKTFENVEEGSVVPAYEYTAPDGYTFSGWGEIPEKVTGDLVIEGTTTEELKVTDISVDKDSIEVPYAKSEKIAEYIKTKINVQLVYNIKDNEDVDKADVNVVLGDGKVTVSVAGYNFTKDVTYTIDEPILTAIIAEKGPSTTTFEWNEVPTIDDAKAAYGKIFARYDFDNADGYIERDVTAEAVFSVLEADKAFKVEFAGYNITFAQFTLLSAPKTVNADKSELTIPYGTSDWEAYVKENIVITVTREDGTPYNFKDNEIKLNLSADKTQATFEFVTGIVTVTPATVTLVAGTDSLESLVVEADAVEVAYADKDDVEVIKAAVKAAITKITASWTFAGEVDVDVEDVTIEINTAEKVAAISYNGKEDTIAYTVAAPLVSGFIVDCEAVEVAYGTAESDVATFIKDNVKVYYTYEDDSVGTEAVADFDVNITGRSDKAGIEVAELGVFEIDVTYATDDAYLDVPEKINVPYNKHNEKSDAEIAEYIAEELAEYVVVYIDTYGERFALNAVEYTITYADENAIVTYNNVIAEIRISLGKKSSGSSVPTGTVVRPAPTVKPEEPVDPVDPTEPVDPVDPSTELPYKDVEENDWAYEEIKELHAKGIINGDYGNALRPDFAITREEVAKIVLKAKGIKVDETLELNVADPENVSDWAKGYVATAMKEGIIKGYGDGTVKGTQVVTRAELATIIVRTLNATSEVKTSSFNDVTDDDWFAKDVECAKQLGIIKGYEDGSFRGNNEVTRREAFVMAYRMMKLIELLQQ